MTAEYWYMLPVAAVIATTAMASGIGGATLFVPMFILVLGLPPQVAVGTGLITEVFGFASGVSAYARRRMIDYRTGLMLLAATVPLALIGTWAAGWVPSGILKTVLAMGLLAVAFSFLRSPEPEDRVRMDAAIEEEYGGERATRVLETSSGERIRYKVCNPGEGMLVSGMGGLFLGLISTGLGELNGYFLHQRCRVPSKVSVATSVFVVAVTALSASVGHLVRFVHTGGEVLGTVLSLVVFTVPGVIIGAQLGAIAANRIPERLMERSLAVLFFVIAVVTIGEVVL